MKPVLTAVPGRKCSSVDQFCADHGFSRAMFYKLLKSGDGPRLMRVGKHTLISEEAAAKWRQRMTQAA